MAWISKTDYVLWRECAKNAWLKLHRPEVYYAGELTEFEQAVIDAGIEVEGVARGLFPGGVLVTGSKAEAQEKNVEKPRKPVNTEEKLTLALYRDCLILLGKPPLR